MCRFVLYEGPSIPIASLITEPSNSLINQSIASRESEEPLNGDGFGVAWYVPELSECPAVFRSLTPAWSNSNLLDLARVTKSSTILAHVRAATPGNPVTELNCHPFSHGRFAFMHNGDLGGFLKIRRALLNTLSDEAYHAIEGSTDSEHLFGLFLNRAMADHREHTASLLAEWLEGAILDAMMLCRKAGVTEHSYLNLAVSNGRQSVAARFTTDVPEHASSLYAHHGRKYECADGVCRMIEPEKGKGAILISSEPLSADPGWQKVPVNHLVMISEDREATVRAIAA